MKPHFLILAVLFSVVPAFAELRMTEIQPGSVYERMGLQNGDVLVAIDGKKAKSAEQLEALFKKWEKTKRAKPVIVVIKRKGTRIKLTYETPPTGP